MLRINAIKIEVNTSDGLFGCEYTFNKGLNIIKGDNSSGKSTLFQSILYALGFEELLGGKNEKTMQSVLKDQVEFPKGTFHQIIQSFVYLEFENKSPITVRRSIVSGNRKSQLVDVYEGNLLTGTNKELPSKPMYIHDKGGASDSIYGFHHFLCEFLNWDLPELTNAKGEQSRLFIQQIAPAFIVEQKSGWSDFFATIPYFGLRNTESRVIEFLLHLDVFENEKKKEKVVAFKSIQENYWRSLYGHLSDLADKSGGVLRGVDQYPSVINSFSDIFIGIQAEHQEISLRQHNEQLKQELVQLEKQKISLVGQELKRNEKELNELLSKLNQVALNYEMLAPELTLDYAKLEQYQRQLKLVEEDLRKNKGALKVKNLGHKLPTEIASDSCPTCHQPINDSLLPIEIKQVPMRIEDNISFLEAQSKMIEVYVDGQNKTIKDKEKKLETYKIQLTEMRQRVRDLKKELIQDERLPSEVEIEKKLNLRKKVEYFSKVLEEFNKLLQELREISRNWAKVLVDEKSLPSDYFSTEDRRKLTALQQHFIILLKKFNYQSKPFDHIRISNDNYLPVAQKMAGEQLFYNIKFDSSASDFIRCIWAYFTALIRTAEGFDTNHPLLLILDEPKQQDMSMDNFSAFLHELSEFKQEQILVFASFENSPESFSTATKDLKFTIQQVNEKLIRPIF